MKLNAREQRLLIFIGAIVFLLLHIVGFSFFRGQVRETRHQLSQKREEWKALQGILKEKPLWAEREAWRGEHQPKLEGREQAAVALLEEVRQLARAHGILLESPELRGDAPALPGAYQPVAVQVETRSSWKALIAFLHALQRPEAFIVLENTHLQIDSGDPTMMRGRFRIARWYAP